MSDQITGYVLVDASPVAYEVIVQGVGTQGLQGPAGNDGRSLLNGAGVPSNGLGNDGDFYIDTVANTIYGPKVAGVWGSFTSILGATGPAGANGTNGTNGINGTNGAPGIDGIDGIDGTNGTNGSDGIDGIDGTNGYSVLSGYGAPSPFIGSDGDFYIDLQNYNIYGPKFNSVYGPPTSLVGPPGAQGAQGPRGFDGAATSTSIVGILAGNGVSVIMAIPGVDYEPPIAAGTSLDYYRGDKTFQPFAAAAQAAVVTQTVTNGVTTTSPSEDAVFDAIAAIPPPLSILSATIIDGDVTHAPDGNSVFDALALKADLASPAFTGLPTAPTQAALDNSTKIATTAYADAASVAASSGIIVQTITNGDTTHVSSSDALFDALALKEDSIGYVPEDVANKDTDPTLAANSDIKYPSQKAVKAYIDLNTTGNTGNPNTFAVYDATGALISSPTTVYDDGNAILYSAPVPLTATDFNIVKDSAYIDGNTLNSVTGFLNVPNIGSSTATVINTSRAFQHSPTMQSNLTIDNVQGFIDTTNIDNSTINNGVESFTSQKFINTTHQINGTRVFSDNDNIGSSLSTTVINYTSFASNPQFNTNSIITNYQTLGSNPSFSIGSSLDGFNAIGIYPNVNGSLGTNGIGGVNYGPNIDATNAFTGNMQSFSSNGNIHSDVNSNNIFNDYTHYYGTSTITGQHTGVQLSPLFDAGCAADSYRGISISPNGTGSTFANDIKAIEINVTNLPVPANGSYRMSIEATGDQMAIQSNLSTADYTLSGVAQQNLLGGEFHIAAGFPVSGSFVFGNNLGTGINAEDNMAPDLFAGTVSVGYAVNGFVNQVSVSSGKTMDTVSYMLAGGSFPPSSTGGTITNLTMFRAIGILPGGGTLNVTNLYGFKLEDTFDLIGATNAWGFYNASNASDNWFSKSLTIGVSKKQSAAGIGLEVADGDVIFSNNATVTGIATLGTGSNAVTQSPLDNSTKIATTAYVDTAIVAAGGGGYANISVDTLATTAIKTYFADPSAASINFTLPLAASNAGKEIEVKDIDFISANVVNILVSGADLVEGQTSDVLVNGEFRRYKSNGSAWYITNS